MKRMFALLLALAMLLGLMPTAMAAEAEQAASGTTVQATELPGVSRPDEREPSGGQQPAAGPQYQDDDIVTVIVQLDEPSLLEYYNQMGGQAAFGVDNAAGEEFTAGEAVSAFFELPEIQDAAEDMLAEQQSVLSKIGGLQATTFSAARSAEPEIEVVAQWTAALNGMAVRVPYGSLSAIRAIDGVKRAYVQHTYDAPEPVMSGAGSAGFSYDMVNLNAVWQKGYTGKGMLVAVVDTGLDLEWAAFSIDYEDGTYDNVVDIRRTHEAFRENSFQSNFPDAELRYTRTSMGNFLSSHTLNAHRLLTSPSAMAEAAYKNRKVVYAFDYAGDVDTWTGEVISGDLNVYPGQEGNPHGTHVAGTIAGYAKTDEGEVIFSGVAPDAQLVIMKVFADVGGGATDSAILNALDDSLKLGVDVVNLSLGADNGFADDDTVQVGVYANLEKAGLILMTSAGNAAFSSTSNERGNYNLSSDPEISMVSSPAVYSSNIAVASINNSVESQMTLVWSDGENEYAIPFTDPFDVAMKSDFAPAKMPEGGIEIVPTGVGNTSDYYAAFGYGGYSKTGIALVQRGGIKEYSSPEETLSFVDKVKNANSFTGTNSQGERYGVKGVLIYNYEDGDLINMGISLQDGVDLASAFISREAGEAMIAAINEGHTVTLKWVNQEDKIVEYEKSGEMSEFTSWGAGPGLELKPDITAPGGNIWSAVFDTTYREGAGYYDDYTGSYAMMSGTSMAAPHMSGLGALVRQFVQVNHYASGADAASLTSQLLVSTAVPQMQKDSDAYYSPRQQGAGLADVNAAITTPAYITVDGQSVGKLELLDDYKWTGAYDLEFKVHNLTGSAVTYDIQAVMQRPATKTEDGHTFILDSDVLIKNVDLGTVTVPANGETTVTRTIYLSQAEINTLKELFPNGTYIEGFITLINDSDPQIGLPYLAFLGDWTAAPIFDSTMWYDQAPEGWTKENEEDPDWNPWDNGDYTWYPSVIGSMVIDYVNMEVNNFLNLGQNNFDFSSAYTQKIFHKGNFAISPNRDGYFDTIDNVSLYQMREAKLMVVEVRDAETNELYFRDFSTYNYKGYKDASRGVVIPSSIYYFTQEDWDGTDLEGNRLPSGTRCVYTITAYGEGDYGSKVHVDGIDRPVSNFEGVDPSKPSTEPTFNGHPMDKTGNVISFPVVVDYEAPKLKNSAVSIFVEDGRTYLSGTVNDADGSLASVQIVPLVNRTTKEEYLYGSPAESEVSLDRVNPFLDELIWDDNLQTYTFKVDVTEYAHTNQYTDSYGYSSDYLYDWEWTGAVYLYCGDYAYNDRAYSIIVEDMAQPGEILLSQTSAKLHTGSEFELSVIDNTGSSTPITRTSTNPEVATVDEFGNVVAVGPGQATIVVTNGESTAYCVVAVEDWPTEVIDFDLSIRDFRGLQAGVPITVEVTNLQPADVVIDYENSSWLVYENDDYPEEWTGILTVSSESGTYLAGQITLLAQASEELIPGGTGYLEVTLNGHSERMAFSWNDVPTSLTQDYLISASSFNEQTIYVPYGETATLVAMYKQNHSFIPVELYTREGYEQYGSNNPTTPATGLILDGPTFAGNDEAWSGKLVNQAGYKLPETIVLGTRYNDGYESEMRLDESDVYGGTYMYDPSTGVITVPHAPYGSDSTLFIRADGVEDAGNPGGQASGTTYTRPDGTYGPFNWTMTTDLPEGVTSVEGTLTPFENELLPNNYNYGNGAYFTPSAPGVSYITAASKDGQYSVNFAVICEPIKAESLDLNKHQMALEVGASEKLIPTLTPEPTLDSDKELIWTSFSPDVATVDAQGNITAVSEGYAYIKAALKTNTTIQTYCIVTVGEGPNIEPQPITYVLNGGTISDTAPLWYITNDKAQTLNIPEPTKDGYVFTGWTYPGQSAPGKTVTLPAGFSGDLTLTANWEETSADDPTPPAPPAPPVSPVTPGNPSTGVTTSDTQEGGTTVTETTATPDSTVEGSSASAGVSAAMGDEIVKQAVSNESETVVIAPKMDDTVTSAEVSIPADTVSELAEKTEADVRVETPVATVVIPNEALADLAAGGGQVTVSTQRTDDNTVEVTVKANGQRVDSVTGGMTVTVPQENCGPGTVAMLVFEDGTTQVIRQSLASADGQSIDIPLGGSAKLVIADNSQTFTDVPDSNWAADAIAFASSHELMNGIGGGFFDPKSPMTRGMLAMVLHNLENNQNAGTSTVFSDVRDDAWYSDAIQWAASKGIVNGYPDGSFAPKESISREQLAVMLYRYAGSPEVSSTALNFTDADNISGYAKEAMAWAVENHILQGKGNGVLDPKGDATRAETAQMLLNFMVNVK